MASGNATSDIADRPVLTYINMRIRNLRENLARITQLEESIAQGNSIIKNTDQEELLKSKPTIIAMVDELEKSRQPLSVAVDEEITLAIQRCHSDNDEDCNKAQKTLDKEQQETDPPALPIDDLLSLIYFGNMFDMRPIDLKSTCDERCWCLMHDTFQYDHGVILGEEELNAITMLSSLMISRPDYNLVSHQDALQRCIEHANHWICKSKKQIDPHSEFTYADVREMLKKVMGLGYYKNTPSSGKRRYQVMPLHEMGTFLKYEKEEGVRRPSGYSECCSDDDYGCSYRDVDGFSRPDTE